jgi:hypothetical protein
MRDNQYPDPFETERVGHPKKPIQSLGVEVLEGYHLNVKRRQEENWGGVGHPPVTTIYVRRKAA